MSRSIPTFIATLALGLALTTGSMAAAVVKARYSVSLIGLRIGEASARSSISSGSYRVVLEARLTGIAAWVARMKMALASSGAIRRGAILPAAYATTAANSHETRTIRMALESGTVRAVEIAPPIEDKDSRVPVSAANKRNVLDPMSALIMAVPVGQSLVGPAACDRTLPVYDGVIRFDLTMSYSGTRNVSVPGYSGPVSICSVRYTPVSGHRYDSKSTRFMAANRDIEVWLAPVEQAHVDIPFRVILRTMAGMADISAIQFSVEPDDETAKSER